MIWTEGRKKRQSHFRIRKEISIYKLGTVAEFNSLTLPIPEEVKHEVSEIATMLDERFRANRDVEFDEGDFIFIAIDDKDLAYFREKYVEFNSELLEYVLAVKTTRGNYLNAFYLYGYDYGISLFMPVIHCAGVHNEGSSE